MTVEITQYAPGQGLKEFIQVHHEVYRGDPNWVAPLEMEIKERLSPKKNPFFLHAEAALFVARKDGRLAGRITAQIDREHLKTHQDETGFFGFFDTLNDQEVATALLAAAGAWLREHGMKHMRGPYSLSINEEMGLLVEGFEQPPAMMMTHALPYQGLLAEGAGLKKVKDVFSWRYDVHETPERAKRAWETMQELPELRFRSLDKSKLKEEVPKLLDIFNDAWSHNWGFVPSTDAEADKMAKDLALVLDPELSFFAEIDGRPVAMCVCLPNLNEVIRDFNGKLNPSTVAKLLWRLKVKGPKSARLMLLGIRKELRGVKRYGGLSMALYAEIARRGVARGYEWAELGWTLEDNRRINLGIQAMGGKLCKRYRVYEKPLGDASEREAGAAA